MSKRTKWIIAIVVIVLVLGGLWWWQTNEDISMADLGPVKIGALYAQTGPAAQFGELSLLGVNDAIEYFISQNPGAEIELITEDSQADPKQATISATKMTSVDQVGFSVVGMSAVSAAVGPIADQYEKIFISDAALFGLTKDKTYLFQNFMPALGGIAKQINAEDSWNKVAVVYINDDFGQVWSGRIQNDVNSPKEVEIFPFAKDTTDFSTDALKIKEFNPDVVVVMGYGPALNKVHADISLHQIDKPIINYLACTLPGVLSDPRFNLEGQYSYEYPEISDEDIKVWMLDRGRDLNTFYTAAFDNTLLALNVAKDSGNDPEKAVSLLRSRTYPGLWGDIDFAGVNSFERDLVLTKIVGSSCSSI